jgi:hypothetical protein
VNVTESQQPRDGMKTAQDFIDKYTRDDDD